MEITLLQASVIPVIVALVAVVKRLGVPAKFLPVTAVILGIVLVFLTNGQHTEWLAGIVAGLSAAGLYSGTKTTVKGVQG